MGFTETTFLFVFMPVSILLYFLADKAFHKTKYKNIVLVALSMIFYLWANKEAMLFVLVIGLLTHFAGLMLEKNDLQAFNNCKERNRILLPVCVLIAVLIFYKYVTFVATWINQLACKELITLGNLLAPIGLSFIIFESVSYLVDIYRRDAEPGSLLDCFTFLLLFPKIVSGPIVLWKDFKPQLSDRHSTGEQISAGIDRIIIGYAKKAIIADSFGAQIALINSGIAGSGVDVPTMWLRALLYFFQLYFDFSGYSDIAIGLCSVFGFSIKENFQFPYLSKSVSEFWRRWHISLGSWFREYVYIPLGGNRRGNVYVHLLIVFILTGLWHGTGIPYLIWGLFHGVLIVFERALNNKTWYRRIPNLLKWAMTMLFVYFAWIMFMSKDLGEAFQTYKNMFKPMTATVDFTWRYYLSNRTILFLSLAVTGHVFGLERIKNKIKLVLESNAGNTAKRIIYLLLFIVDVLYVVNSTYSPFIYFQF